MLYRSNPSLRALAWTLSYRDPSDFCIMVKTRNPIRRPVLWHNNILVLWTTALLVLFAPSCRTTDAFAPVSRSIKSSSSSSSSFTRSSSSGLHFSFFSNDKDVTKVDDWTNAWRRPERSSSKVRTPRRRRKHRENDVSKPPLLSSKSFLSSWTSGSDRSELSETAGIVVINERNVLLLGLLLLVVVAVGIGTVGGMDHLSVPDSLTEFWKGAQSMVPSSTPTSATIATPMNNNNNMNNPVSTLLDRVVSHVQDMGPTGVLYFGLVYTLAELLAVPAIPLTASAGYLFGVAQGTAVVLVSATIAASIAFWIGKTVLRSTVLDVISESYPQFEKLDAAIGKSGLKVMLLVRLAPIFPFSLSNYLYGASSVTFGDYMVGTLLGFAPGTLAYVYTGTVGKALFDATASSSSGQPWYVYVGALTALAGVLKLVADVATNVLEELEQEE